MTVKSNGLLAREKGSSFACDVLDAFANDACPDARRAWFEEAIPGGDKRRRPILSSPRHIRVVDALKTGRWVSREELDRGARSSNSPDVIYRLRRKLGQDAFDMRLEDGVDRDGEACRTGSYRLTAEGHARLINLELGTRNQSGQAL